MDPTVIDLFAGCGGLSLGLHEAGWRGLFAIEKDPMAFETLHANFLDDSAPYKHFEAWPAWLPKTAHDLDALLGDPVMRRRLEDLRGSVGLVAGGPPCQGFSVGGRRDGLDGRNRLVHSMLDFVGLVRPRLTLVENVEGIAKPFKAKPGETASSVADAVADSLNSLGYSVSIHVVDASRFGVPQTRRRVLILGVESSVESDIANNFEAALESARKEQLHSLGLPDVVSAREAIADLAGATRVTCPDSPKFDAGTYKKATSTYAKLMRRGIDSRAIPDSHRFSRHGDRIRALYEDAHATQPPGRLTKAFLMSWETKKDKKVLLDPDAPASTITTHPDEFIHYSEPRNVTVREMARLQSFPDDFVFRGRYTINGPRRRFDVARCSQVGNAVPPLLARAVGLAARAMLAMSLEARTEVERAVA